MAKKTTKVTKSTAKKKLGTPSFQAVTKRVGGRPTIKPGTTK